MKACPAPEITRTCNVGQHDDALGLNCGSMTFKLILFSSLKASSLRLPVPPALSDLFQFLLDFPLPGGRVFGRDHPG